MPIIDSRAVSHDTIEQNTLLIDIATRAVVCLRPGDSVGEAARVMAEKRISCIVVTDEDGHPLSIVTERNMLHAMQSECPAEMALRDVMPSPVISVPKSMTCLDAYQLCLREGIRHLVIVDDNKLLLGVVSETDFRQHINLSTLAGRRQVASVMSQSVFTQPPEASLRDALNLMQSHRDTCVVVVEDEHPIGIVTERDIVRLYSRAPQRTGIPLREIMTSPVLTISLENSINDAAERLLAARVRHLVVVNHAGRIAGLLSEHDLTHNMALRLIDDKLIEEGAFLRTLLNTIPDMLWLKDVNGAYRACNSRFERFCDAKEQDIIGKTDYDFVDKELADTFREHDRMAMASNEPTLTEAWCTYADDRHRELLETLKMPMRDSLGNVMGLLGVSRDITEHKRAEQTLLDSKNKLHEQKERLASILESSLDAFMLMNADGVITLWSGQAEKMFGWTREEAVGRLMHETIAAPRYREAHARGMKHFLSTGEAPVLNTRIEVFAMHRDGHEFPVELSISRIKTADGDEISSFARDITERKHMERQLDDYRKRLEKQVAEESTKFRALVEQSLVGNYIIQDDLLRYVNSGFAEMFGYDSPDELVDQGPALRMVAPEDRARVAENIRKRLSGEIDRIRFSFTGCKRDGTAIVVDVHGRVIDYQGKPAIIGTLIDITETRRNQHELERLVDEKASELRRSEEKLRTLIEAIPDPIQFKDGEGRWLESNFAARQVFGLDKFDCHGKTDEQLSQLAEPQFRESLLQCRLNDEQAWNAGGVSRMEEIIPLDDGDKLFFDIIKKPLFHDGGKRSGLVVIGRDVTALRRSQEALAEQERLFRAIFDQAPSGIELIDPDTLRFIEANPAACDMLGYTHEEYLQLRLTDTQADRDEQRLASAVQQITATGGMAFENRHRCKNGDVLDVEVNARILDFPGKRLLVGVWRDITERKRTERQLMESELQYRTLADSGQALIWTAGADKQCDYFNKVWLEFTGRSLQQEIGNGWVEGVHPDDVQCCLDKYVHSFNRREKFGMDYRLRRHDGTYRWIRDEGCPRYNSEDEFIGYIGFCLDITERKRAEDALRENEEKLRNLYNLSPLGIALTTMDGQYEEFNASFLRICGYSEEELKALDYWALTPKKYQAEEMRQLKSIANTGRYGPYEKEYVRKDGSLIPLRLNGMLVTGRDGRKSIWSIVEDITERKRAEAVLRENEAKYRLLFETAGDGIFLQNASGFIDCNENGAKLYGLTRAEIIGRSPADLAPKRQPNGRLSAEIAKEIVEAALAGEPQQFEWRPLHANGDLLDVEITLNRVELGGSVCLQAVVRDITERKRAEENLRITASVFDNSQEALLVTDANNTIIEVNPAFTRITGYSRAESLGRNPKLLSSGRQDRDFYTAMWQSLARKKAWRGEIWNRRKSGEVYAELLSISAICDDNGNVQRYVGVFSDISYLKAHEAELSRVAHYDALTGIPNRVLLADRMKQAIAKTAREQNIVAICYLDLDGFKSINDSLGHDAGDQVLVEVAKRIENAIRGGDTVARLGGDEFVVLLELEKGEECIVTLERLLAVIAQPIMVKDKPQLLSASIGVSLYPLDDKDPDTLLRHADQAMYTAKQSGKNCFYIYDPELDLRTRNHNEFLKNIRYGLENNQFELYFQPKINLHTKQLIGAEALIRWRHPERGLLSPAEFLRPIENTELDIDIGNWVIATALAQLSCWHRAGLDIELSINISAYHLESACFMEKLRQQLARYTDISADKLQIEILETAALNDLAVISEIIEECRKLGVGFALDDFGTGYSSLLYLSKLPVDVLKIDQSFVRDMLEDEGDKTIVQGIIALANAFDRQIVAEGIETEEHYRVLLDMGCRIGQGYGIARPMPADQLPNWRMDNCGLC